MIAAIELAVLALLRDAGDGGMLGYRFKTLDSYPEEWDEYLKAKRPSDFPAAWIVFAGLDNGADGEGVTRARASFGVLVAARNLRNETATRHGGGKPGEPGSYQLLEDVVRLLSGQRLHEDADPFVFRRARFANALRVDGQLQLSAIAAEFTCEIALGQYSLEQPADFALLHADWDFGPFGDLAAALPLAAPDAADAIDLETAQ